MVTEIAQFRAQEGKADELQAGFERGLEVIRRAEGCQSARLLRGIEDAALFVLEIQWQTIEHHTVTFRGGPLFGEYRSHIAGLFVDPATVSHYQTIAE